MSIDVFGGSGRIAAGWRLPAAVTGFARFLRAILDSDRVQNEVEVDSLSDRYLEDIGVERRQISEQVRRQITHDQLLGTGWRSSSRRR